MFSVDQTICNRYPKLASPRVGPQLIRKFLRSVLCENQIRETLTQYSHLRGIELIEQFLEDRNVRFWVREDQREHIPSEGRVVIIANHPIGSLDALALIRVVADIRRDVKVVANELLMSIDPLHPVLLPVNNMGGSSTRENLLRIKQHLENEGALIIFPAGEVSRLRPSGVQDTRWNGGFLRLAGSTQSPIVPVHIQAHNSPLFYGASMIYKPLATLLLAREMFLPRPRNLRIRIGASIPFRQYNNLRMDFRSKLKGFRSHLYRIGRDQLGIFRTQSAIALPEARQPLRRAIEATDCLGNTEDGLEIRLYHHQESCPIMREIGRLRELSFRSVGEGSGRRRDIDRYDRSYMHLILWHPGDLEIVGSYRIGDTQRIVEQEGLEGLYTSSLFEYGEGMKAAIQHGLELGRSFVQPKYWGRRSLHYLWWGIGAFLARYPHYRYMFGPVSISAQLPKPAKEALVYFYRLHFGSTESEDKTPDTFTVKHKRRFVVPASSVEEFRHLFGGQDYAEDLRSLRKFLNQHGASVPTLYRQYTELCDKGGAAFLDFGIDPDFENCIDGLVRVDISRIKTSKAERYIAPHLRRGAA